MNRILALPLFLCMLLCLFHSESKAQEIDSLGRIVIDETLRSLSVKQGIEYGIDSSNFDIKGIQQAFIFSSDTLPDLDGVAEDMRIWAHTTLFNPHEDSLHAILSMGNIPLATFYLIQEGQDPTVLYSGHLRHLDKRALPYPRRAAIRISLPPHSSQEIYIQLENSFNNSIYIFPYLYHPTNWEYLISRNRLAESPFLIGFLSIVAIILLYNLMIFFSTRDLTYLYYSLYLLTLFGVIYFESVVDSYGNLGFNNPIWHEYLSFGCFAITNMFIFLFGRSFVEAPVLTPKWDPWIKRIIGIRMIWVVLGLLFLAFGFQMEVGYMGVMVLLIVETLFLIAYFIRLAMAKSTVAWFFIVGTGMVYLLGFVLILIKNIFDLNIGINLFVLSVLAEILIFSLGLGYKMRKQQQEKLAAEQALNQELSKINSAFGRFVPHEFLKSLGHTSVLDVKLGDQVEKEVTVLFSDIRGYTTLAEQMSPEENFQFLNAYLGRMGPIIQDNKGFVNQYYGDGIMALFMHKAKDALQASINMIRALETYNAHRSTKDRLPLQIGLGLHTGSLMMGIIGDTLRLEAGVVSDTVNTASRMEGLTKHFGSTLIFSDAVYAKLEQPDAFSLRYLGQVQVKGRKGPTGIYECLNAETDEIRQAKEAGREQFQQALGAYQEKRFEAAIELWESVLTLHPTDRATLYYLDQARTHIAVAVPEDWLGVEALVFK